MIEKRIEFDEVFETLPDRSLQLKRPVMIGNSTFTKGTTFRSGIVYGGVDFDLFKKRPISVEIEENADTTESPIKIVGFYPE